MQGDSALGRSIALVRDLRARCAWDRAQTPQTLRPYLVEEALELDQALRSGDPEAIRDELGDLLLHLAFQIVLGEERSQFNAEVVTRFLEEKMWRRHPHLFAGAAPGGQGSWELAKRREPRGGGRGTRGTLSGLPAALPPLLLAYRLQERAAGVGFDWKDARGPLAKVKEETAELEREMNEGRADQVADEVGDLLFAAINLARKLGVEPGQVLERANAKFTRRFEALEALAAERGVELGHAGLDELDRLWEEVKKA
jgi:MazG family protein